MLAIKARRALGKESQTSRPLCHVLAGWHHFWLLLKQISTFLNECMYTLCTPLHTKCRAKTQCTEGRRLHAQLRMAAPPCAAR